MAPEKGFSDSPTLLNVSPVGQESLRNFLKLLDRGAIDAVVQGFSFQLKAALRAGVAAPRLIFARALVESAIASAVLLSLWLAFLAVSSHLSGSISELPPSLHPITLLVADLLIFLGSAEVLRWGQRAAEFGTIGSGLLQEDDPPLGLFESLLTRFDRSVLLGVLEFAAGLGVLGFASLLIYSALQLVSVEAPEGAFSASGSPGAASALLALALSLSVGLWSLKNAVFSLAVAGCLGFGRSEKRGDRWSPLVAPASALSLLLRHPFRVLGLGFVILLARTGVALAIAAGTSFAGLLPAELSASTPALFARGVAMLIGIFGAALAGYFSESLLFSFIADSEGYFGAPVKAEAKGDLPTDAPKKTTAPAPTPREPPAPKGQAVTVDLGTREAAPPRAPRESVFGAEPRFRAVPTRRWLEAQAAAASAKSSADQSRKGDEEGEGSEGGEGSS